MFSQRVSLARSVPFRCACSSILREYSRAMRFRPHSSITRRGASLIEVLVAASIFLAMTSALITMMLSNQRAATKIVNHNDTTTEVLIVYERIRMEMRHSLVINAPDTPHPGSVQYWQVDMPNGVPVLDANGLPTYMHTGLSAPPDVATMYSLNGTLYKDFRGETLPLAQMGVNGTINFDWDPNVQSLWLTGAVGTLDYDVTRNNYLPFKFTMKLTNNI